MTIRARPSREGPRPAWSSPEHQSWLAQLTPTERDYLKTCSWPENADLRADSAMVIWEEILNRLQDADDPWERLRARQGTATLRTIATRLIDPLTFSWHLAAYINKGEFMGSFDWDFTPRFLRACVEVDDYTATPKAGWIDITRAIAAIL